MSVKQSCDWVYVWIHQMAKCWWVGFKYELAVYQCVCLHNFQSSTFSSTSPYECLFPPRMPPRTPKGREQKKTKESEVGKANLCLHVPISIGLPLFYLTLPFLSVMQITPAAFWNIDANSSMVQYCLHYWNARKYFYRIF